MASKNRDIAVQYDISKGMLDQYGLPKLSDVIDQIARKQNLNNSEIAAKVGEINSITSQSIGRIRAGEAKTIAPENLAAICKSFQLPLKPFLVANFIYRLPENMREEGVRAIIGSTSALNVWQRLSEIQVATHIRVDAHTWRAKRAQGESVSDISFAHGIARPGKDLLRNMGEGAEESFLFRHSGHRMVGNTDDGRCIPNGAILLIKPLSENEIMDGDFVLVQFFSESSGSQEEAEDAAIYRYVRRTKDDYAWEEYHSFDQRYPVRIRNQGKFKEHELPQTRAILGKAMAILYTHLDIA